MVQARLWTRVFGHPVGSSLVCESVSETGKLPISVSCGLLPEKRVNIWLQDQAFLGCSIRSVTSVEVFGLLCVIVLFLILRVYLLLVFVLLQKR